MKKLSGVSKNKYITPAVVAKPDERHANRTASVLEWYDRHRANNISFKQRTIYRI